MVWEHDHKRPINNHKHSLKMRGYLIDGDVYDFDMLLFACTLCSWVIVVPRYWIWAEKKIVDGIVIITEKR